MAMPMIDECHSPSLKHKIKTSICCFTSADNDGRRSQAPISPYAWFKSTAQDLEIKDKCWGLIGRRGKSNRRRYNSADFKYDLASYSLNFEDEINREDDDLPLQNFASRLPVTPERLPAVSRRPRDDELNAWQ